MCIFESEHCLWPEAILGASAHPASPRTDWTMLNLAPCSMPLLLRDGQALRQVQSHLIRRTRATGRWSKTFLLEHHNEQAVFKSVELALEGGPQHHNQRSQPVASRTRRQDPSSSRATSDTKREYPNDAFHWLGIEC